MCTSFPYINWDSTIPLTCSSHRLSHGWLSSLKKHKPAAATCRHKAITAECNPPELHLLLHPNDTLLRELHKEWEIHVCCVAVPAFLQVTPTAHHSMQNMDTLCALTPANHAQQRLRATCVSCSPVTSEPEHAPKHTTAPKHTYRS